jgi:hypothetical protein
MVLHFSDDGAAIYSTGDLGRVDQNGCLELVGRSDAQVKVRGHRVVIGEVEEALLALDVVKDAVVLHREVSGVGTLDAFVVPATDEQDVPAGVTAIRNALAARVATPMVPAHFHLLDELPTLPNGKLDARPCATRLGTGPPGRGGGWHRRHRTASRRALGGLLDVRPSASTRTSSSSAATPLLAAAYALSRSRRCSRSRCRCRRWSAPSILPSAAASAVATARANDPRSWPSRKATAPGPRCSGPTTSMASLRSTPSGALGADQPLYTFESPFLDPVPPQIFSLSTRPAATWTTWSRRSPRPYLLGGYSFGGVLAFEMARTLDNLGHDVGLLAVVDAGPGYRGEHYEPHRPPTKPWLGISIRPTRPRSPRRRKLRVPPKGLAATPCGGSASTTTSNRSCSGRDLAETGQIAPRHRVWYVAQALGAGCQGLELGRGHLSGAVELIWADEKRVDGRHHGLGDIAEGGVGIHRVAESHEQMMDEGFVGPTASVVRALIDDATASSEVRRPTGRPATLSRSG